MSILDEDFWKGRIGQECRMICEIMDEAGLKKEKPDWQLLRQHVQALSHAYVEACLTDYFAADLARAIGNTEAEHAVSSPSLWVFRRAAEKF